MKINHILLLFLLHFALNTCSAKSFHGILQKEPDFGIIYEQYWTFKDSNDLSNAKQKALEGKELGMTYKNDYYYEFSILLANIYQLEGYYDSALTVVSTALTISQKGMIQDKNDFTFQLKLFKSQLHDIKGEYDEALNTLESVIDQSLPDSSKFLVLNNLLIISTKSNNRNSDEYFEKAQNLTEGNLYRAAILSNTRGEFFLKHRDYKKAESYFKTALELNSNREDREGRITNLINLAYCYLRNDDLISASNMITTLGKEDLNILLFEVNYLILKALELITENKVQSIELLKKAYSKADSASLFKEKIIIAGAIGNIDISNVPDSLRQSIVDDQAAFGKIYINLDKEEDRLGGIISESSIIIEDLFESKSPLDPSPLPTPWTAYLIIISSIVFIIIVIVIAVRRTQLNEFSKHVLRVVLALSAAGFSFAMADSGFININGEIAGWAIKAGGPLAVLVLVYLIDPPSKKIKKKP